MIEVWDFESTGLVEPKATQLGKCRLSKDLKLIKSSCVSYYINPEKEISWGAMGLLVSQMKWWQINLLLKKCYLTRKARYILIQSTLFVIT